MYERKHKRLRGGWDVGPEEYKSMGFTIGLPPNIYVPQNPEIQKLSNKFENSDKDFNKGEKLGEKFEFQAIDCVAAYLDYKLNKLKSYNNVVLVYPFWWNEKQLNCFKDSLEIFTKGNLEYEKKEENQPTKQTTKINFETIDSMKALAYDYYCRVYNSFIFSLFITYY